MLSERTEQQPELKRAVSRWVDITQQTLGRRRTGMGGTDFQLKLNQMKRQACPCVWAVFEWQNSLKCEQVSARPFFFNIICWQVHLNAYPRCCSIRQHHLGALLDAAWFGCLAGAGGGFSAGHHHGGGLPQLHQVPHVCLQFPHLCKYILSMTLHPALSEVSVDLIDLKWVFGAAPPPPPACLNGATFAFH